MPLKSLGFQTPYFKLYNEFFLIDHLKIFGCLCFVSTTKINRTKFDPRAVDGVFVGYCNHTKGYQVYDLLNQTIQISRDVIFHEFTFPFHDIDHNNYSPNQYLNHIFLPLISQVPFMDDPSLN